MRKLLLTSLVVALTACPDPAKDKPKAVVTTPAPTPAPAEKKVEAPAPLANAVAYPFTQADSKLSWTGAKVTGKHDGSFGQFGGIVEVVDGDPTKSRVRVEIEMASLTTEPEKLVAHLKGDDFFAVAQFPQARFTSTALKATEGGGFDVTGDLSLHGVTKGITFPAKITIAGDEVTVAAEFAINRKDFNVVYPGRPDDLIADNVAIKLDLHARKRAAEGAPAPAPAPAPAKQ